MFTIVSLMREEPAIIRRFVDYHLRLDVQKVLIFYDGVEGEQIRQTFLSIYDPERVVFTVLRAADYPEASQRAAAISFETKQRYVHKLAQKLSGTEWILTLDADEFLWSAAKISSLIGSLPSEVVSVQIAVSEAVWGPGDQFGYAFGCTHFRNPFSSPYRGRTRKRFSRPMRFLLAHLTYFRDGWLFQNNVAGHSSGRHFFRRSVEFDWIGPHGARITGQKVTTPSRILFGKDATMRILHFDAISLDRWVEKLRRRISNEIRSTNERKQRQRQFSEFEKAYEHFLETSDDRALRSLMKRLYGLNIFQQRFLQFFGCAFRADVFPQDDH